MVAANAARRAPASFTLAGVVERRAHFSYYSDSAEMLSGNSDPAKSCASGWSERKPSVPAPASAAQPCRAVKSVQRSASLKLLRHEKRALLNDLQRELQDIGVRADSEAEERARQHRDELHAQLSNNRSRRNRRRKRSLFCEAEEMENLTRKLRKLGAIIANARNGVTASREAGWCQSCGW